MGHLVLPTMPSRLLQRPASTPGPERLPRAPALTDAPSHRRCTTTTRRSRSSVPATATTGSRGCTGPLSLPTALFLVLKSDHFSVLDRTSDASDTSLVQDIGPAAPCSYRVRLYPRAARMPHSPGPIAQDGGEIATANCREHRLSDVG